MAINLHMYNLPWFVAIFQSFFTGIILVYSGLTAFYFAHRFSLKSAPFKLVMAHILGIITFLFLFYISKYILLYFSAGEEVIPLAFEQFGWQIWGSIMVYFMLIFISYTVQYIQALKEKEHIEIQLRKDVQNAELEALKYQLNPHFLFNSLNNINALITLNPEKARDMLVLLSDFLREATNRQNVEGHSLDEEIEQIQRYLKIERIRFEDRLTLSIDNCIKHLNVPPLLLQPLIENVIKHGVSKHSGHVEIKLNAFEDNQSYYIEVFNSLEETPKQINKNTGLNLVEKRLHKNFGEGSSVHILLDDGFKVQLVIPK